VANTLQFADLDVGTPPKRAKGAPSMETPFDVNKAKLATSIRLSEEISCASPLSFLSVEALKIRAQLPETSR
jgi:hypothetical protein